MDEKKSTLMEHSALTMNRRLQSVAQWDEETIANRGEKMFKLVLKIWPRPSSAIVAETKDVG